MRRFIILFLITFSFLFLHIYQKVKILVLAYELREIHAVLDNLSEGRSDLAYNFYKEINYANIKERLAKNHINLNYPKEYVKLIPRDSYKGKTLKKESILARILSITSQVEAQP